MTMKVNSVYNVVFRSTQISTPTGFMPENKTKEIKELKNVTPDFNISVPVKYNKIAENKLTNGLVVYSYKMSNGYQVNIVPMKNSPAVVKSYVNVGSMNETKDIKGISHFLEHMAFNGTNGDMGHIELKQGDSFKKIDKLGGWANASTNYAMTDYVNSTPLLDNKDLETQIKVIAAMAEDLKLSNSMIEKEKGPVSSEINMILDDPQTIGMDQTVRTLFNIKNPADELVGGSVKHIQNLTRDDVLKYYNTYYTPNNTNIVITGDVNPEEVIKLVAKNFTSKKVPVGDKFEEKLTPINNTVIKDFITNKTNTSQIIIGFAGAKNNDTKDKILFDLASTYLDTQEAGLNKKLKNLNSYPIISSEKISTNPNSNRLNFIMLNSSEENCEKVLKTVFNNLQQNKKITTDTLNRLKQKLKQENDDILESSIAVNDYIGYSVLDNDFDYVTNYDKILDSITPDELQCALRKHFNPNKAAITVIHPNKNNPNFKGRERTPLDIEDISEYKLKNNFDVGFYNTQSNNINISLKLFNDIPYTKKPGVTEVLNEIYKEGIYNLNSDKFEEYKEKNNINLNAIVGHYGLGITMSGDANNLKTGLLTMKTLLYNPNITEENLKNAVLRIKDKLQKTKISSSYIQQQFDNALNPYAFTRKEIRENLDNVTLDDLKELHRYILKNSRGIVTANIPKKSEQNVKTDILNSINSYLNVEPNKHKLLEVYREIKSPIIISVENHNSQADISETFRFKYNNTIKEKALAPIMNSILSNSSIGLFDNLREKQNLAYSVHSYISSSGNQGKITLNILTTTDNKDIGEHNYKNLQKSIDGFNNQIRELIDGKFTDEDLEIAKRSLKASLLNKEGYHSKLLMLEAGLDSQYGIELKNKIYKEIDNITKQDIIDFAKYVFSNKPIYTITATKETLDSNREYLEQLKR